MSSSDPWAEKIRGLSRVLVVAPSTGVFASAVFQVGLLPDRAYRVQNLEQAATIRATWAERGIKAAILDLGLSDVPDEEEEVPAPVTPERPAKATAKLTVQEVKEIRALAASGAMTREALAEKYRVSSGAVEQIMNRKTWAHVP